MDGQHCLPDYANYPAVPKCESAGTKQAGEACSSDLQCAGATTCRLAVCRPFCASSADCNGNPCALGVYDYDPQNPATFHAIALTCADTCTPLPDSGCPKNFECIVDLNDQNGASGWVTECIPVGIKGAGQTCNLLTDCGSGTVCFDGSVCRAFCLIGGAPCATGTCTKFPYGGAQIAGKEYGYCK